MFGGRLNKSKGSKMKFKTLLAASVTVFSLSASEEVTQTESFGTLPEGWSATVRGGFLSPEYPNEVRRIALAFSLSAPGGNVEVWDYLSNEKLAFIDGRAVSAGFEFSAGSGIRRLELRPDDAVLESFTAAWLNTALSAPENFIVADSFKNSALLMWDAVEGANSYRVTIWTNTVVGASEGTDTWRETFSKMPVSASNQQMKPEDLGYADHGEDWKNQSFSGLYHLSQGGGIRLGKTTGAGEITVPHILSEGENLLRVSAFKYDGSGVRKLGIYTLSADGSVTNGVAELELTDADYEYRVILPGDVVGGKLLLKSMSSSQDCRVGITEISIWKDFSEGREEKAVIDEKITGETSAVVGGLPESGFFAAVTALDGAASGSSASTPSEIAVRLQDAPKKMLPGSLVCGGYAENFDGLSRGSDGWFDGKTVPYFLAAQNGGAAEKFSATSGTGGKSGGLYAFHASGAESYSLAAVANSNNKMAFGFCISNDTAAVLKNFTLSFTAKQWTFDAARTAQQNLRLFAAGGVSSLIEAADAAAEITSAGFSAISNADFKAKVDGVDDVSYSRRIEVVVGDIALKPGEKAVFYWAPDQVSNADALGVDDVSVSCTSEPMGGFAVYVAALIP